MAVPAHVRGHGEGAVASRHVTSPPVAGCIVADPAGTGPITASSAGVRGSAGAPTPRGPAVIAAGADCRLLTSGDGTPEPGALSAGAGATAGADWCGGRGAR